MKTPAETEALKHLKAYSNLAASFSSPIGLSEDGLKRMRHHWKQYKAHTKIDRIIKNQTEGA